MILVWCEGMKQIEAIRLQWRDLRVIASVSLLNSTKKEDRSAFWEMSCKCKEEEAEAGLRHEWVG